MEIKEELLFTDKEIQNLKKGKQIIREDKEGNKIIITYKDKTCKVEGCNKGVKVKGYCLYHYSVYGKDEQCSIENCINPYYAKGYCRNHYELNKRNGRPDYLKKIKYPNEICLVENCDRKATVKGLCSLHRNAQIKYGYTLEELEIDHRVGENNIHWNGGISEYPNHSLLKKNRLIKLKQVNYTCEECGGKAIEVHHKDLDKSNHDLDNLKALCKKCRLKKGYNTKFKIKYGKTKEEIVKKYKIGYKITTILDNQELLKDCIKDNNFKNSKYKISSYIMHKYNIKNIDDLDNYLYEKEEQEIIKFSNKYTKYKKWFGISLYDISKKYNYDIKKIKYIIDSICIRTKEELNNYMSFIKNDKILGEYNNKK